MRCYRSGLSSYRFVNAILRLPDDPFRSLRITAR